MYILLYIFFQVINLIICYMVIHLFIKKESVFNTSLELVSFILYYFASVIVHLMFKSPIISILTNIICLFIITLNYEISFKNKILLSLTIFVVFVSIETLISFSTQKFKISILCSYYSRSLGLILMTISYYLIFLFLRTFKEINMSFNISDRNYIYMLFVPLFSIIFFIYSLSIKNVPTAFYIIFTAFVFFINVFVFNFYKILVKYITTDTENKFLIEKEKIYNNQIEIMKKSLNIVKEVKHDLKNHVIAIKGLLQNNNVTEIEKYIDEKFNVILEENIYVKTNNIIIDSILNFKLQEAKKNNIKIECNVLMPSDINIKSFDLITILGNILDNAIEANMKVEKDRFIFINIKYDRRRLIINIKNKFNGILKYENNKIITTKTKNEFNNLGLSNVKNSLKKYNGDLKIDVKDDVFLITIMIFI